MLYNLFARKLLARTNIRSFLAGKFHSDPSALLPPQDTRTGLFSFLKRMYKDLLLHRDRTFDKLQALTQLEPQPTLLDLVDSENDNGVKVSSRDTREGFTQKSSWRGLESIVANRLFCPRSVFLVPCSSLRVMQKIPDIPADCFMLDLHSSATSLMKREARDRIWDFIYGMKRTGGEGTRTCKRLVLRISSPDFDTVAAMLDLELAGILGRDIEGIAIPKVTIDTYHRIREYLHPDHQIWALFDHPISVLQAESICLSGKYTHAVMGHDGLTTELHLPLGEMLGSGQPSLPLAEEECKLAQSVYNSPLWYATNKVLFSARAAKMFFLDGVYNDSTDKLGFRRDLLRCHALGIDGKCLRHPDQIALTHQSFIPNRVSVEWAIRVREKVLSAKGQPAILDGALIEDLHTRQADRVLALYQASEQERQKCEVAGPTQVKDGSSGEEGAQPVTSSCAEVPRKRSRRGKPAKERVFP